jgi:hypothetical protein
MSMSYRIDYAVSAPKGFGRKARSGRPRVLAAVIAACLLLSCLAFPEEAEALRRALFPWTLSQVRQALADMTAQLRSGDTLRDAVTAFCQEILREAAPIA